MKEKAITVAQPGPEFEAPDWALAFCQASFSLRFDLQWGQMFASWEMVSRHSGQCADLP